MMKSKMTMRIVCAVLTLLLVVGMVPAQVNAASYTTYKLGDVNGDGKVSVADATLIQRYLVRSTTFSAKQKLAADVNLDGNVSILDATAIQQYCAKMIDSFDTYCDDTWVSLSKATTKKFTNVSGTVSGIAYINGSDWLIVSQSGKTVTIKTRANTGTATRDAIVVIKNGSNVRAILVRQLGETSTYNLGGVNCYAYALQLHVDPTLPGGSNVTGPYVDPGDMSNCGWDSAEFAEFNIINYSLKGNPEAMFVDAENYVISRVRDDLATMGWGIKEVSSPNATVAKGNWLIALSVNPTEYYSNGTQRARLNANNLASVPTENIDYHWYRRVDLADGTSYWTHKLGNTAAKDLNVIPENIFYTSGHKVYSPEEYLDTFADYADLFISKCEENPNQSLDFIYCNYGRVQTNKAMGGYVFLGYYVVGPNV